MNNINNPSSPKILNKEIINNYTNNDLSNKENTFLMETEIIPADIEKIKKVYSISKKLFLEIISCDNISDKYIKLEIDPYGYVDSKREKDSITYFGYQNGNSGIDYVLSNSDNFYFDNNFNGKHFMIQFNPDDLNYYIKDLGIGCGTFIKIQEWTEIRNNLLINIGENYLVFSLGEEELEETDNINNNINNDNCLNIKIFSMKEQHVFTLYPDNCPVTIGRNNENNIVIEDDLLSRIHCTIDFNNDKWYIQDGYAKNGIKDGEIKKSTNGSWIYAYEEIKIIDQMVFKANRNLFICSLV